MNPLQVHEDFKMTYDESMSIVHFSMIKYLQNPHYYTEFMRKLDSLFIEDELFIGKVVLPMGNIEEIIIPVHKIDFRFIINLTCKKIKKEYKIK
jgi:hypothetical protein